MKLNIEIDSGSFEKVVSDGIKSLSQEELNGIIKQVIYEAFTNCQDFKDLLMNRRSSWNGSELTLGPLATQAIKSIDMETSLAPFKEKMVNALIENHREIVESMLFRCMVDKISTDGHFRGAMEDAVHMVLAKVEGVGRP